jgi:hypothetical protein
MMVIQYIFYRQGDRYQFNELTSRADFKGRHMKDRIRCTLRCINNFVPGVTIQELRESVEKTAITKTPDALLEVLEKALLGMKGNEGVKWRRLIIHMGRICDEQVPFDINQQEYVNKKAVKDVLSNQ